MGLPSVVLGLASVYWKDGSKVSEQGFLHGYTPLVWAVVAVQAAGGLLVAVVVKYADNIMKTFATSFAIILGAAVNAVVGGFRPDGTFAMGAMGVGYVTRTPRKKRMMTRKRRRKMRKKGRKKRRN